MPYADDFYKRIEAILGQSIVDAKNIYKLFSSFEDENNWMGQATRQLDLVTFYNRYHKIKKLRM